MKILPFCKNYVYCIIIVLSNNYNVDTEGTAKILEKNPKKMLEMNDSKMKTIKQPI